MNLKGIPVATYGLCASLQRGDKFQIRKEADTIPGRFKDGEEVEIADFGDISKGRVPCCKNIRARLLKFKGHEGPQWHPIWIVDCTECPFYSPDIEKPLRSHKGYLTKGNG